MNTERLTHCRLFTGDMEKHFENVYLRYAWYAERFYCEATAEQDARGHEDLVWYDIDIKPYKDIPYPLLCSLFSVWMNKLAGTSNPDVVVPGFHKEFMPAYLNADRLKYCRYFDGVRVPDMEACFDEYYFAMAEKFYVSDRDEEREQYLLNLVRDLHLDDLVSDDVPIELLAQLFGTHDHVSQRGSWEPCPREHVAKTFREKFFPKYLIVDVAI